jgi:hypothetical protein
MLDASENIVRRVKEALHINMNKGVHIKLSPLPTLWEIVYILRPTPN